MVSELQVDSKDVEGARRVKINQGGQVLYLPYRRQISDMHEKAAPAV